MPRSNTNTIQQSRGYKFMDTKTLKTLLKIGETITIEFKRCGNKIESDVYETVCAFLNRFGGDILLGVLNDGTVNGVSENAAPQLIKNFIKCIGNPDLFTPTIYLMPETIKYNGKTVIHIHIPPSAEVHSFKKVIYDRIDDADVKVTSTSQIAQMYIRKQNIFTEKRIYPYVRTEDLRLDLLPKLRKMAANNSGSQNHPWNSLTDEELLKLALKDKLHQPYREKLVPGLNEITNNLKHVNGVIGTVLCGAGPAILIIYNGIGVSEIKEIVSNTWDYFNVETSFLNLPIEKNGAVIL